MNVSQNSFPIFDFHKPEALFTELRAVVTAPFGNGFIQKRTGIEYRIVL